MGGHWRYGWGLGKWGWKALSSWYGAGALGGLGWGGLGLGGLGGLGYFGAAPLLVPAMFYLLGTPYWGHGIMPGLIIKILLVKAKLLVGPPIALGAFVIGQGAGLLIGKLLGIRMVLKYLRPQHKHIHHFHKGWKPVHHAVGWKPWRLRLRLPFFRRFRFHPRFPPPPHFNFHAYPPIKHIHYSHKPYGTYNYAPEATSGWSQTSSSHGDTSGWLPGRPPGSQYEGTSSHVYNAPSEYGGSSHGYKSNGSGGDDGYKSYSIGGDQGYKSYSSSGDHGYKSSSGAESHGYQSSGPSEHGEQEWSSSEISSQRHKKSSAASSDIQDFLKSEILKMKSEKYNAVTSEEEAAILNEILNEHFVQDLADAIETNSIPDFVPLPDEELVDPLSLNATVTEATPTNSTTTEKPSEPNVSQLNESLADALLSSVMKTIKNYSPLNFVPETLVSWITASGKEEVTTTEKSRRKRDTVKGNEVNVDHVTKSIVKDIKNLFNIISFLDIGRCLEKMVCEIHSQGRKFTDRQLANSYEGNIITAFRIMESIMPDDTDENVVKYRDASRLGQKHDTAEVCVKNYVGCPVSTSQLVRLGSLITDSPTEESATS